MRKVSGLKSLSLRVVADVVWDALTLKSSSLEPTLEEKITFLQLIQYLSLPTSLKQELSHVLETQYKSYNLFQMMLMIEMGLDSLDFRRYLRLGGNLKIINLLKLGKKSIKRLFFYKCVSDWTDSNRFRLIQTQEFLVKSFPYLRQLNAGGTGCDDYTLRLVATYCPHLKWLLCRDSPGITDQGIEFLCSPQSVAVQLVYLSLRNTNVTASGAEKALKHLACLEILNCSSHLDTFGLLKSLWEQELVFVNYKDMSITFTEETREIYKCKDLVSKLPQIFPNLCSLTIESEVSIDTECLLFLRSLSKIANLDVTLDRVFDGSISFFPCDSDKYHTNFYPQMNNLTKICLRSLNNICVHSILNATPCLRSLTIQQVIDSRCTHEKAVTINLSVLHLALLNSGEAVVEKCLGLCPSVKSLEWINYDEMQFRMNYENLINLTHLSLDCLHMETATCLVKNCKNLQVLHLMDQLPESKEVVWLQKHSPFVTVLCEIEIACDADWFLDERFSPCCLCQAYES